MLFLVLCVFQISSVSEIGKFELCTDCTWIKLCAIGCEEWEEVGQLAAISLISAAMAVALSQLLLLDLYSITVIYLYTSTLVFNMQR